MLTIRVLYRNTAVHEMIIGLNSLAQIVDMLNSSTMVEAYQIWQAGGIVKDYQNFGWIHKPEKWMVDGFIAKRV